MTEILDKYFTCGICREVLNQPYTLFCQHTFCRDCLKNIEDHYNDGRKCPDCRTAFILAPHNRNYLIEQFIDDHLSEDRKRLRQKEQLKISLEAEVRKELELELFPQILESAINKANNNNNNNNNNTVPVNHHTFIGLEPMPVTSFGTRIYRFMKDTNRTILDCLPGAVFITLSYTLYRTIVSLRHLKSD